MGLLERLKAALGLDAGHSDGAGSSDRGEDGGVRVEREPDASTEAAVKGTDAGDDDPVAAGTDAAGSTGSITETPPETPGDDDVAEAAEPAEAAGPASQVGEADDDGTAPGESHEPADEPADDRPVREISGIGPAYERRLNEAGVETVGELAAADATTLAEAADIAQGRVENWIESAHEADG